MSSYYYPSEFNNEEKEAWRNHLNDKWSYWSSVISRIKKDEQNWISVLLIVFGAVLFFLTNIPKPDETNIHSNNLLIGSVIIATNLFSLVWGHYSLILRKQYYTSILESLMVEKEMGKDIPRDWDILCFDQWWRKETKPYEGKIVEFALLSGLLSLSCVILYWKLLDPQMIPSSPVAKYLPIIAGVEIIWPLRFFYKVDRKRLLKL